MIVVPMLQAFNDPSGAIMFTVHYFGQMLLGLTVGFVVTHAWGVPARDPLWHRPEPTPIWPVDRYQAHHAARVTLAMLIAVGVIVVFDPPGKLQIVISTLLIALVPSISKADRKVAVRFLGCILGAALGLAAAIVTHELGVLLLLVLTVFTILGYLAVNEGERGYLWLQA